VRDKNTPRSDFIFYSDRIIRILVEEGLNYLPVHEKTVTTPTGIDYTGAYVSHKAFHSKVAFAACPFCGPERPWRLHFVKCAVRFASVKFCALQLTSIQRVRVTTN
jgi:hypothetical protein